MRALCVAASVAVTRGEKQKSRRLDGRSRIITTRYQVRNEHRVVSLVAGAAIVVQSTSHPPLPLIVINSCHLSLAGGAGKEMLFNRSTRTVGK